MGFRVPLTSASEVDTNPGGPGVRIYTEQQPDGSNQGFIEFSSGVPGQLPGVLTQYNSYTDYYDPFQDKNLQALTYSVLELDAPQGGGGALGARLQLGVKADAPAWDLNGNPTNNPPQAFASLDTPLDLPGATIDAHPVASRLGYAVSSGTTAAPSTANVSVAGVAGNFTISSSRRVLVLLSVGTAIGASGGELGRVNALIDGAVVKRAQWVNPSAGAAGEVSPALMHPMPLAAGSHSFAASILRVNGGTSVSVSSVSITLLDLGP